MKKAIQKIRLSLIIVFSLFLLGFISLQDNPYSNLVSYIVDPKKQNIRMYWKDDKGQIINNFGNLKTYVEAKEEKLIFVMNGGMYKKDFSPQGLYVNNNAIISPLDTLHGSGNFYLKPNGIFFITKANTSHVCTTEQFIYNSNIKFATQSGPMLVIDGKIHEAFKKESKNLNIRNGVGILPDNKVLFAISKEEINFYDFAKFFQSMGCTQALYLDGFVSRAYIPEKEWIQLDGNFGVMIAVTE